MTLLYEWIVPPFEMRRIQRYRFDSFSINFLHPLVDWISQDILYYWSRRNWEFLQFWFRCGLHKTDFDKNQLPRPRSHPHWFLCILIGCCENHEPEINIFIWSLIVVRSAFCWGGLRGWQKGIERVNIIGWRKTTISLPIV